MNWTLPRIHFARTVNAMFDIPCPRHRSRVLLTASAVEGLVNTGDGVVVHWRCYCGARGEQRFARRPAQGLRARDGSIDSAA
jgi:hypothetical protein